MKSYNETILAVREVVRTKAANLDSLKGSAGCIRILFRPLCKEADEWANGLGYNAADIPEYETVFTLRPSGTHTTTTLTSMVNHYGLSALQIACCSKNRAKHGIRLSYAPQSRTLHFQPNNGYLNQRGAVCYTITKIGGKRDTDWARIYISVSGGIDTENEVAATEAYKTISKVFSHDEKFRVI